MRVYILLVYILLTKLNNKWILNFLILFAQELLVILISIDYNAKQAYLTVIIALCVVAFVASFFLHNFKDFELNQRKDSLFESSMSQQIEQANVLECLSDAIIN